MVGAAAKGLSGGRSSSAVRRPRSAGSGGDAVARPAPACGRARAAAGREDAARSRPLDTRRRHARARGATARSRRAGAAGADARGAEGDSQGEAEADREAEGGREADGPRRRAGRRAPRAARSRAGAARRVRAGGGRARPRPARSRRYRAAAGRARRGRAARRRAAPAAPRWRSGCLPCSLLRRVQRRPRSATRSSAPPERTAGTPATSRSVGWSNRQTSISAPTCSGSRAHFRRGDDHEAVHGDLHLGHGHESGSHDQDRQDRAHRRRRLARAGPGLGRLVQPACRSLVRRAGRRLGDRRVHRSHLRGRRQRHGGALGHVHRQRREHERRRERRPQVRRHASDRDARAGARARSQGLVPEAAHGHVRGDGHHVRNRVLQRAGALRRA